MEYKDLIKEVQDFNFIQDRDTADAVVKAVFGIMASRMKEDQARKLVENLPDPLDMEKLRGEQFNVTEISIDQYYATISNQFHIDESQARTLVSTIIHFTKDAIGEEKMNEIKKDLPSDWAKAVEQA